MKLKLNSYIKKIEKELKKKRIDKHLSEDIYTWILFFQHERLVHLIVTFFTGISMILLLFGTLYFEEVLLLVLFIISLLLFAPYIIHYYYLENGVQKLYNLYFEAKKKATKLF